MRAAKIVLSALIVITVLFSVFYFYVNRREFGEMAHRADQQRQAWDSKRNSKREELAQFVASVQSAEQTADAKERCLATPDMPGSQWDKALVIELCRVANLPIVPFEKVEQLLRDHDAAQVDRIFDDYAKLDVSDPQWRGGLLRAFEKLFAATTSRVEALVEHWVNEAPKSANAHIARAMFRINHAYSMRGVSLAGNTPGESFAAMRKDLDDAITDLKATIAIDPQRKAAWALWIEAAMSSGDQDTIAQAAQHALAIDPLDDTVYDIWLAAVDPRWGGPPDGMQHVVETARSYIDRNPLLKTLDTAKRWREETMCCEQQSDKDYRSVPDYREMMRLAPMRRAMQDAASHFEDDQGLVYASELIRFWPSSDAYLRRAEILRNMTGKLRHASVWADADVARAKALASEATASPSSLAYLQVQRGESSAAGDTYRQILKSNPRDIDALRHLIEIDIGQSQNFEEAQSLAVRLEQLQPEVLGTWTFVAGAYPADDEKFCSALKRYADLGGWAPGVEGATKRCAEVENWTKTH